MPDRENVIRELRDINMFITGRLGYEKAKKFLRTIDETIILLKEQNAVKPICQIIFDVPYYFCGSCKTMLNMYATKAKYCSQCRRQVEWE